MTLWTLPAFNFHFSSIDSRICWIANEVPDEQRGGGGGGFHIATALNVEALSGSKRNMFKKRRQGLLIAQLVTLTDPVQCVSAAVHVHNSVRSKLFPPADSKQPHFLPLQMSRASISACVCISLSVCVCVCVDYFSLAYECPSVCECLCNTYCRE